MSIHDESEKKHTVRALHSILHIMRSRRSNLSVNFTLYFLQQLQNAVNERSLHQQRKFKMKMQLFQIETYSDEQCLTKLRFRKTELFLLNGIIPWPESMNKTKRLRYRTDLMTSFCLMCRRLSTVCRWSDLEEEFFLHKSTLCEIFYEMVDHFYSCYGSLVCEFRDSFVQRRAELYSSAIFKCDVPLDKCIGFIDGTNIFIKRPKETAQRATYSGHKKRNSIKMQTITTPDGLILHIGGPVEGRRHDMTLFRKSGIEADLQRALLIEEVQYYIYGDPAYVLRPYLQIGFQGANLTPA